MNILDQIVEHKKLEVLQNRTKLPIQELQGSPLFDRKVISFSEALRSGRNTGIIAEFKRRSPSKGIINDRSDIIDVTSAYVSNGAAALSVLTDHKFFGGSNEDLQRARIHSIPILRKDFIIDEYQIVEAKAIGADVILLIAACLTPERVKKLASFAKLLGLEVLLEIHSEEELEHICEECDVIGVNNRDLKTFMVDLDRSIALAENIPAEKIKIAESGISDTNAILKLRDAGFSGFLIGENFMKQDDPAIAFASFVKHLKNVSE